MIQSITLPPATGPLNGIIFRPRSPSPKAMWFFSNCSMESELLAGNQEPSTAPGRTNHQPPLFISSVKQETPYNSALLYAALLYRRIPPITLCQSRTDVILFCSIPREQTVSKLLVSISFVDTPSTTPVHLRRNDALPLPIQAPPGLFVLHRAHTANFAASKVCPEHGR